MKAFSNNLSRQLVLVATGAISITVLITVMLLNQTAQHRAQHTNQQPQSISAPTPNKTPASEHQAAYTISENGYFKLQLPAGWRADDEPDNGPNSEAAFKYKSDKGASFSVAINSAAFGGGEGDGSGSFTVIGDKLKFDRNFRFCKPGDGLNLCKYGDGKLKVYYTSAESLSGRNYIFDIRHQGAESLEVLLQIIDVIETLEAK